MPMSVWRIKQKNPINFNLSKELFEGIGSVGQGQPTKIKASGLRGDLVVAHRHFPKQAHRTCGLCCFWVPISDIEKNRMGCVSIIVSLR